MLYNCIHNTFKPNHQHVILFASFPNSEVIFIRKGLEWCTPRESTLCCEIPMHAYMCTYIHCCEIPMHAYVCTYIHILQYLSWKVICLVIHKQTGINTFYVGLIIYLYHWEWFSIKFNPDFRKLLVIYWQTCGWFYCYHINDHTLHL